MNNNYFFQPKASGSISFRQTQSLKTNDENSIKHGMNKSLVMNVDENIREFGKDITNLTIVNNENVNPNSRKSIDIHSKKITVS